MGHLETLVDQWWVILAGAHIAMFLLGLGLWFTRQDPIAILLILLALLLPLAMLAVVFDGQD